MNAVLFALVILSIAVTQLLVGGRNLALSLPGYGLLALAALLSWWPARRTAIPRAATECLMTAALFFICVAVRALYSQDEYLARNDLYLALGAVTLYLIVALNLTDSRFRSLFVAALLLLGFANGIVGAIQFFKGQEFMVFDFLPRTRYGTRASGFYGYPNYFASFIQWVLLLGLGMTFWSRWPTWAKMLAGYTSGGCLLALLLTGSRGGYISCATGLLVFGVLSLVAVGKLATSRGMLIIVGSLAFVIGGLGVKHLMSQSYDLQSRAESTLTVDRSRMLHWKAAWHQFRLSPITGTGSGTYLYYGRQFRSPEVQSDPVRAHNEYLQLLAEYGIIGVFAAVVFLDTHLRNGWKSFLRGISRQRDTCALASNSLALTIGAVSAAVACLVHAFVEFNLHAPANMLTMAFVFGLLASPSDPPSRTDESDPGPSAYFRLALPLIGVVIAVRALPTLPAEWYREKALAVLSDPKLMASEDVSLAAERLIHRGLAWDAKNPELHAYLGTTRSILAVLTNDPVEQTKRKSASVAAYERALELTPRDEARVLSLAWTLHSMGRDAESEVLFKRAVELDPNSGAMICSYATFLHILGRYAEAEWNYRKAMKLQDPTAQEGLKRMTQELNTKPPAGSETPPPR